MHLAARYGAAEVIRCLSDAGSDVNRPDKHGLAPLYFALNAEKKMGPAAAQLLMERGAKHTSEFNVLTVKGLTPEEEAAALEGH
jgi:ankyrin repeat protein